MQKLAAETLPDGFSYEWTTLACQQLRAGNTAVFSGMIGVTVFGLIFTPVFYVVTRWIAERMTRMRARGAAHPAE